MPISRYGTEGGLPICPVTALRKDCQYVQLLYKGRAIDMPNYGTKGGLPICPVRYKGRAADMPSYDTKGGLPICTVTVEREDCQHARLRYKGRAADMPSYSAQWLQSICPFTAHTDGSQYVQTWERPSIGLVTVEVGVPIWPGRYRWRADMPSS